MIRVAFTKSFLRKVKRIEKSDKALFEEIFKKIELFKNRENHHILKFSKPINYMESLRIISLFQ